MDMASELEKRALEEILTAEVAECLVYEASKLLTSLAVTDDPRHNVFHAFANLGRVALILGDRLEKVRQELYKMAEGPLSLIRSSDFSEEDFRKKAQVGFMYGWGRALPARLGFHSIHCGFVAELVGAEYRGRLRYVEGVGWEVREAGTWYKRPKEIGIVGIIYEVMKRKIKMWREVLENPLGEGGWLEKLEKNINDPDWLSKVEELLLRVNYFGVQVISSE